MRSRLCSGGATREATRNKTRCALLESSPFPFPPPPNSPPVWLSSADCEDHNVCAAHRAPVRCAGWVCSVAQRRAARPVARAVRRGAVHVHPRLHLPCREAPALFSRALGRPQARRSMTLGGRLVCGARFVRVAVCCLCPGRLWCSRLARWARACRGGWSHACERGGTRCKQGGGGARAHVRRAQPGSSVSTRVQLVCCMERGRRMLGGPPAKERLFLDAARLGWQWTAVCTGLGVALNEVAPGCGTRSWFALAHSLHGCVCACFGKFSCSSGCLPVAWCLVLSVGLGRVHYTAPACVRV